VKAGDEAASDDADAEDLGFLFHVTNLYLNWRRIVNLSKFIPGRAGPTKRVTIGTDRTAPQEDVDFRAADDIPAAGVGLGGPPRQMGRRR
jgi:hypothetical protein